MGFPTMWYVQQQRLRPACAYAQSDQSLCTSLEYSMTVKLLTEQHLGFLSLKGGCTGSSESTFVTVPHCWKSHVTAQLYFRDIGKVTYKCFTIISDVGFLLHGGDDQQVSKILAYLQYATKY